MSGENLPAEAPPPPIPRDEGSIASGCGYGCGAQVVIFALTAALASALGKHAVLGGIVLQILVILGLVRAMDDLPKTVTGLWISGSIGLLLSTTCAAMVYG
jgi:hypothetical protein